MPRAYIYDTLILRWTARWYAAVLERMQDGASVLDVGIGTAGALQANAESVTRKGLTVTGIDIDAGYIRRARHRIAGTALEDQVELRRESVYDHQGGPYDAIYFSASFMLLPDPEAALRHCSRLLTQGGHFYFTQTIQQRPSRVLERLKPVLKAFTSIDFGRVTYEQDFRDQLAAAGLELEAFEILGHRGPRAFCLAVARLPVS